MSTNLSKGEFGEVTPKRARVTPAVRYSGVRCIALSEGEICEVTPKWLRITPAVRYSGMSRTALYELIRTGRIRSFSHKAHPEAKGGIRFISVESLDRYLDECAAMSGKGG